METTGPKGYSLTQIVLHWIVAVLVAGQYLFNDAISQAWRMVRRGEAFGFDPMILAHIVAGGLILVFVVWRVMLRLRRGAPPPPQNEPGPLKLVSQVAHWGFYAVLAGLSVSGAVAWFGNVGPAALAHEILKTLLLALVVLHVLAVPFHRIALKNNVMQRMIRPA